MQFIRNNRIDDLLKKGDVEAALREPVLAGDITTNRVAAFLTSRRAESLGMAAEDVAFSGLTLGDFLYDYIRIDPTIVKGVAFARAADVNGVLSFARFAETKADLSGASLNGLHSQLQGYVAEQFTAHHLVAQGHDVSFPHTAHNPGWDLTVDGHPFQVKCLADPRGVFEHLHRYPDIPVIVNSELSADVSDHAGVYVDPELHRDVVRHATEESLHRGRELADFEIPWVSVAVSGGFNLVYMFKNQTDWIGMVTCTATDTAGRVVVGTAGKLTAAAIGTMLFGPAGAIVGGLVGSSGGAMVGRRVSARVREFLVSDHADAVRTAARRLSEAAAEAMPKKLDAWSAKSELLDESLAGQHVNQAKIKREMRRRIADHVQYWRQKKVELEAAARNGSEKALPLSERTLTLVRRAGIHPHQVQSPLKALFEKLEEYRNESRRFRTASSV